VAICRFRIEFGLVAELGVSPARIYADLLANANDCITVLAFDGRTVFQSPALASQLGYRAEELIGHFHHHLLHPDDRADVRTRFEAVCAGQPTPVPIRVRCRHKNGTWRLLELTTSLLVEVPRPPFIVLSVRDVTALSETTAALRASEHRLDLALQLGAMGVTDFDYRTGELSLSAGLVRLMGYETPPLTTGLSWFLQHVHGEDRGSLAAIFNAIKTPLASEYEALFRMVRDGTIRWWFGRVRVIRDDSGHPTHAVGLVSDITERRQLEEQVRQGQKMEALGQLTGGIAHDFNNLLTVISGYADSLRRSIAPADPRFDDLGEIQRAADRAALLTQQLLAFSRNHVLRRALLDTNVVVRDIASMIGRLIGSSIDLKVALAGRTAPVLADRGQIEQVLINLAVNARDAMPQGGTLEIRTTVVDVTAAHASRLYAIRPGKYVRVSVCDTGIGMPPDVQARVFEPFFTTKDPGKGTGIGLSTVYGIVTQSGGGIFLTSEAGVGTTFDVYLPFATGFRTRSTPAAPVARLPSTEPHGAATVLVVEDFDRVRVLAHKVLARYGYRVLTAQSGAEAIDLARACDDPIDLLVTDVVMPGMSGPELARALNTIRPDTPVVYMSGYAGDVLDQRGVDADEAAFLEKPFTPTTLARKVREVLATRDRRA
jgi:two-component system, cell cycle sensor histidine kinase and response regulator CckA